MKNTPVDQRMIDWIYEVVREQMNYRLQKHGPGKYASPHESLGIIAEEYHELIQAITKNDGEEIEKELYDIAVAALFAIASLRTPNTTE